MFAWNQNISPSPPPPVIWAQKAFLGEFLGFFVFPLFGRGGGRLLRFLSLVTVRPKRPPERQTTKKVFFRGSRVNLEHEFVVLDDTSPPLLNCMPHADSLFR